MIFKFMVIFGCKFHTQREFRETNCHSGLVKINKSICKYFLTSIPIASTQNPGETILSLDDYQPTREISISAQLKHFQQQIRTR